MTNQSDKMTNHLKINVKSKPVLLSKGCMKPAISHGMSNVKKKAKCRSLIMGTSTVIMLAACLMCMENKMGEVKFSAPFFL